ncbi:peptide ABC transporter ATPase [Clostridium fallax]|uniref:Peptide/nickel transport system ATP-binding protein/oligopeptide transport system ATP-binding protein n=2 Tax=Clostridium fallax TaxID=1533 RepID=A0A1M4Y8U9_9CLOT|nr:peptide/nickel transport system ATP-binding protein/oligopeptide transport system ATP-binding protein [Clostridium fallax]SQB06017.1 peptide ABC transporter ATPase [Clostridium fallax]
MKNSLDKDYILEVNNLKKYFSMNTSFFNRNKKYLKAIDDVSFKIERGKIMALVGESGCGKSTTGKVILNLIKGTGGEVIFDKKVLFNIEKKEKVSKKEITSIRKNMQIIFQDPYGSLDPRKNINYIVSEGLIKHKLVNNKMQCEKVVKEYLNYCGINDDVLDRYPHEFSGGQRQRIGIARALVLKPKFIVCDEPTAALDVSVQSQILNLMLHLKDKFKLTYLFISHNLNVVKNFSDYIGVMYLGIIVEKGKTKDIFENPLHPYTKALISSIPKSHPLEKRERILLKGEIPTGSSIPEGCRFHTRCPYAKDICKNEAPIFKEVNREHFVCCHFV